ncbi:Hypothetical predicted protein [Scomber scombrus]|uniref:Uncharacterized protein n=1 Tax=Scomber scombrus TaxID=13677 RepID=A0AAV1NIP4_SCOSC
MGVRLNKRWAARLICVVLTVEAAKLPFNPSKTTLPSRGTEARDRAEIQQTDGFTVIRLASEGCGVASVCKRMDSESLCCVDGQEGEVTVCQSSALFDCFNTSVKEKVG